MKNLIVILMSLNFILTPVAMAQTPTPSPTPSPSASGKPSDASSQFENNPNGKNESDYMSQIRAMGQAAVGSTVILNCRFAHLLPSLMLYMAGSVAYIASEVMGGKQYAATLKKKKADIEMVETKMKKQGGGGEVQKEALEQALKEQEDTLAFIKKRQMWLKAITAIYAAATIAAVIEMMKSKMLIVVPPPGQLGACIANPGPSTLAAKGITVAYDMAISQSTDGIGKYGSMAAAVMLLVPKMATVILKVLNPPEGRIAIFGAHAALAMMDMSKLGSKASTVQGNIDKLKKAIDEFNKNTTPTNGLAGATTSGSTSGSTSGASGGANAGGGVGVNGDGKTYAVNALPTVETTSKTCVASSSTSGIDMSASACANPLKIQSPGFDASMTVPTLSAATLAATDMANSLAKGDAAGAEVQAGNLASMAARLDQAKTNLVKQMNDKLIASGEKPIDVESAIKNQVASINAAAGMGNSGAGAGSLASLGKTSSTNLEPTKASKDGMNINTASTNAAIKAPGADTNALVGAGGISEGDIGTGVATEKVATLDEKLNEFESNESDINTNNDTSLFQQLSNRYLLNYPKIFQRKELTPAEQPKE